MPASATLRLTGSAALGHIGFVVQESWEGGVQEAEVDTRKAGRCSGPGWGVSRRQREERGTKLSGAHRTSCVTWQRSNSLKSVQRKSKSDGGQKRECLTEGKARHSLLQQVP